MAWKGVLYPQALSRREIGGDGDLLDFLIGEGVEIDVAGQPSSEATVGVLDAALLPGRVRIAKPGGHGAHGSQQAMLGECRIVVESDRLSQGGIDAAEDGEHDRDRLGGSLAGEPGGKRQAGLSLMQHEHGPGPLADDEIALPVSDLAATIHGCLVAHGSRRDP